MRPPTPSRIDFAIDPLVDGQRLSLGDVTLEILATPGHTPESITIAVYEHADDPAPWGVLTGDTLFVGDVGRPDLLSSFGVTADDLGRMLYHSLRDKLLPLPDAVRVFPAHGAGSACGKQLGLETSTTIGEQRAGNYALQPMTEEEFVAVVTDGQPTAPPYFAFDATLNRKARAVLDETAGVALLTLDDVLARQAAGAVVLDARDAIAFAAGHLAGSVNVGLEGRFAEYAGDVRAPRRGHRARHRARPRRRGPGAPRAHRLRPRRRRARRAARDLPRQSREWSNGRRASPRRSSPSGAPRCRTCRSSTCATPARSPSG